MIGGDIGVHTRKGKGGRALGPGGGRREFSMMKKEDATSPLRERGKKKTGPT